MGARTLARCRRWASSAGGNFTPSDGGRGPHLTDPPKVGKNSRDFLGIIIKYLLRMVDIIVY